MESAIYEGWVRAPTAAAPCAHAFRFPLAMLYLDLDELDSVFRGRWCGRRGGRRWPGSAARDHLGAPDVPLADGGARSASRRGPASGPPARSGCSRTCATSATSSTR